MIPLYPKGIFFCIIFNIKHLTINLKPDFQIINFNFLHKEKVLR